MEKFDADHDEGGNGKNEITGITDGFIITNVEHLW
jgi:hypothetical protein